MERQTGKWLNLLAVWKNVKAYSKLIARAFWLVSTGQFSEAVQMLVETRHSVEIYKDLAEQEQQLREKTRQYKIETAKDQAEIARLRKEAIDRENISIEERNAAIDQAVKAQERINRREMELLEERKKIVDTRVALSPSDTQALDEQADLEAERYRLAEAHERVLMQLTRQRNRLATEERRNEQTAKNGEQNLVKLMKAAQAAEDALFQLQMKHTEKTLEAELQRIEAEKQHQIEAARAEIELVDYLRGEQQDNEVKARVEALAKERGLHLASTQKEHDELTRQRQALSRMLVAIEEDAARQSAEIRKKYDEQATLDIIAARKAALRAYLEDTSDKGRENAFLEAFGLSSSTIQDTKTSVDELFAMLESNRGALTSNLNLTGEQVDTILDRVKNSVQGIMRSGLKGDLKNDFLFGLSSKLAQFQKLSGYYAKIKLEGPEAFGEGEEAIKAYNDELESAIAQMQTLLQETGELVSNTSNKVREATTEAISAAVQLVGAIRNIFEALGGEGERYGGFIKALTVFEVMLTQYEAIASAVANASKFSSPLTLPFKIAASVATVVAAIASALSSAQNAEPPQYAKGGLIPVSGNAGVIQGPSHAGGGVPLSLGGEKVGEVEGGELLAIVNKRDTRQLGLLSRLNANHGRRFANGGLVDTMGSVYLPHITPGHAIKAPDFGAWGLDARIERAIQRGFQNTTATVAVRDITSAQARVRVADNIAKQGRGSRKK